MKTTGRHGDNLDVAPPEDEVYTETVRETWEGVETAEMVTWSTNGN